MRFHAKRRPGLGEEEDKEEEGDVMLTEMDINHIPLEMREYRVASTEARVTLASAKPLLYMFCAKLPADRSATLTSVIGVRVWQQILGFKYQLACVNGQQSNKSCSIHSMSAALCDIYQVNDACAVCQALV